MKPMPCAAYAESVHSEDFVEQAERLRRIGVDWSSEVAAHELLPATVGVAFRQRRVDGGPVVAFKVRKQLRTVGKDRVLADAGRPHVCQEVRPDLLMEPLVLLQLVGLDPETKRDALHADSFPRSGLALTPSVDNDRRQQDQSQASIWRKDE